MKRLIWLVVVLAAIGIALVARPKVQELLRARRAAAVVRPPMYAQRARTEWLEQNWTSDQRDWFHHADQGTQTFRIPYEWFMALERPEVSLWGSAGLLSDTPYLDRFGFIPDDSRAAAAQLPVGFAHGGEMRRDDGNIWINPRTHKPMARVGLTCAACHTGRFTYRDTAVLVDGGAGLVNVVKFQGAVGVALEFMRDPSRFHRFADRVLGADADDVAKAALKTQLDQVMAKYDEVHSLEDAANPQGFEEGFARLDAMNRIGNAVFSTDIGRPENYAAPSAPVHFPRIWNASWFTWVQYNGSIEQPMVRNAGEALGVLAWINLRGGQTPLFTSSAQLNELFELEKLLAGKQPDAEHGFTGLSSPKWPKDVLPPIDTALATKGAKLYDDICRPCHLPAVTTPEFWKSERWLAPNAAGERYLDVKLIDITHVGTDASQAEGMKNRQVSVPESLGLNTREFGSALGRLVELAANRWYDDQRPPIPADRRDEMNGHRPNSIQALLKYKARPLNGVWATPPYLHNGSVPTLYALLSPVDERPKGFYLGDREYDPKNVGYRGSEIAHGFKFDTSLPGNRNTGHEFNDGGAGRSGVIGRKLSPDERYAIIEFLKMQ